MKLFHDFFNARPRIEVFKNRSYRIRVFLKTQAPLRLSATLSTAGHSDQSSLAI
jgi:hypothetical protein